MDAGIDTLVDDAPRNWLAAPIKPPASTPTAAPLVSQQPAKSAAPASDLAGIGSLAALDAAIMAMDQPLNPQDGTAQRLFAGPLDAPLLLLAEMPMAPDSDESRLLQAMLAAIGLTIDGVVQLCLLPWPTLGRRPARDHDINVFQPHLHRALELVKPPLILGLGQRAGRMADPDAAPATLRGRWLSFAGAPMVATFAPSILLDQPQLKADAWADLQRLAERLAV